MATRPQNQVVRLTRCIDICRHTTMLVRVMVEAGYRWYPEYTVEEQFRDLKQSQYLCTVRIYPSYPRATEPLHCSYGLGVTIDVRAGRSLLDDDYHTSQNCLASEHRFPLYASITPWGRWVLSGYLP